MDEIWTAFKSPAWWVTTVVISFAVNVASAYAKPWLDDLSAKRSQKRSKELEAAKEERQKTLEKALSTPDGVVLLILEQIKGFLIAVLIIVLSTFLFESDSIMHVIPLLPLLLLRLVFLILVIYIMRRMLELHDIQKLAEEERSRRRQPLGIPNK